MRSRTTEEFIDRFRRLPQSVQEQARRAYRLWRQDPYHQSLRFKPIHSTEDIYSVRIGLRWRALGLREEDAIIWFWIGPHAEYDQLIKRL